MSITIHSNRYILKELSEFYHYLNQVTIDLGAGVSEIYSSQPVKYGQWNRLEIMRNGYEVTVTVSSEEGPGEVRFTRREKPMNF